MLEKGLRRNTSRIAGHVADGLRHNTNDIVGHVAEGLRHNTSDIAGHVAEGLRYYTSRNRARQEMQTAVVVVVEVVYLVVI